ncbi:MAG: outer membrane protein assembly factor [Planctomycetaceae bacterium]
MDAVAADRGNRDPASRPRPVLRAIVAGIIAAAGLSLVVAPPSLWLNAAPDVASDLPKPGERLVDVQVAGNTTIPSEHIAKFIRTRPGRPYSERQIRDDVQNLYGKRWFFSIEPRFKRTERGLVLTFHVIERPIVKSVSFQGNEKVSDKKLAALTGLKPGSPFDVSANRQSVRRIVQHYKDEGFAFARVELVRGGHKDHREVVFKIEEGAKVRVVSVKFEGNTFASGPVLRTKIRTSTAILWMFGGLYDKSTIADDIAALKQYYYNLGFFDVEVTQKTGFNKSRSQATFYYRIREGKRYKIRRVVITGNAALKTKDIRKDLKLVEGRPFSAHVLARDVDGIKAKYGRMGRMFAKVDVAPRFLENDDGSADLVYNIDEDVVYRIRRVNVIFRDGAHTKRSAVLNRMLIHPGDLADPRLIRRAEQRLKGAGIFDNGQQNPQLAPQIVFRPRKPQQRKPFGVVRGQNTAKPSHAPFRLTPVTRHPLSRRRSPAARFRMGGNPFDFRLQNAPRESPVPQQPVFQKHRVFPLPFTEEVPPSFHFRTPSKPRRPVFRGQSYRDGIEQPGSPLFNSDPNRVLPPAVNEGDLDVIVSETQTGRLMFGVGVNSDAGVVGSIVLNEYNFNILRPPRSFQDVLDGRAFRGGAQRFRLEAVPGSIVSRYMVSWSDPYFLDTDYSLSLSGFFYNRFFPDWDEERTGGRLSVGRQFGPAFSLTGILRLENVQVSDPDVPTPNILKRALGKHLLTTLGVSAAHDTRDQAFMPGEGHIVELLAEQAVGNFDYSKLSLNASQYFTVFQRPDNLGRHILTLRGQLGWTDSGTPIYERFFAGGFQSFRGFAYRGVSPRQFGVRIGGRWMALGTAEYMMPLLANEMLRGVVFTDFGTVENKVDFNNFRVTAGFGVRISVPQMLGPVPLAFDFGFPILKEGFDDERIFNFYVGFTR